jgi:hypothetical protein
MVRNSELIPKCKSQESLTSSTAQIPLSSIPFNPMEGRNIIFSDYRVDASKKIQENRKTIVEWLKDKEQESCKSVERLRYS